MRNGIGIFIVGGVALALASVDVLAQESVCLFDDPDLAVACVPASDDCAAVMPDVCPLMASPVATGDWGGLRTHLMDSGLIFMGDVTQFYFGVASGGTDQEFRYGGHGDYVIMADGGKLGIQEGLFLKLRAEHRFGESISSATGALMPATLLPGLPVPDSEDIYLTNVLITQALSENFAVFAGKTDTLDGDQNAFAHGRGKTQFSNMAFVANPIVLRTVPYSSLAAGASWLMDGQPVLTFTAINPTDTARTSGFSELFEDGISLVAEARVPTTFFGLPGHQVVGGSWSSRTYVSLGQDPRIITGNVPIARASDSWSLYWNFDQYLVTHADDPTKGWGVFGRAGIGDDRTNPLAWFLSFGVGGNSPLTGREKDTFGAGWYYLGLSNEVGPLLGNLGDGQGVELYYNYEATPWLHLTPDLQVILPGRANVDTALVVGLRACLTL